MPKYAMAGPTTQSRSPKSGAMPTWLARMRAEVAECMVADRDELLGLIEAIAKRLRQDRPADRLRAKLEDLLNAARARRAGRASSRPSVSFPPDLPVSQRRDEIAAAIAAHQVVVLCGETGSGKTTQLPKICLELGRGVDGLIGHTQPRRIAARSVAARIAEELGGEVGRHVGYKVRFTDRIRPASFVKLMTDGILLAETQGDPLLKAYDTLIIDEAHERSLNIDFLLGYLKRLLPRRPDLKLIITSATIDPDRFARHFDNAPILMVSGRTYPVEIRYRPIADEDDDNRDRDLDEALLDAVDEVSRIDRFGDVLIFLPGEREIRDAAEALRKHHPPGTEILPLYARLSAAEQQRIFTPHRGQRIVLATNVAETSLTVPGIRFVIDPGLARISRYSYRTKVQRLPIERISQASANQRAGRCGRVSAGVCVRLYSEEDFANRPEFTEPEIQRTNLGAVILQMKYLRLGEIEAFPFVEPPDARYIRDGMRLLEELGAVDESGQLTDTGRRLARLPVDPRIGRMLLGAERESSLAEVLVIAAALSIQDPRERPLDAQQQADESHGEWDDERSDFLAYLNLWRWFEEHRRHLSQNKLRRLCRQRFLSYVRMREWRDIHQQLHHLVTDLGMRPNQQEADYAAIHRALLSGLLGSIAFKDDRNEYQGPRGVKAMLWPGSTLFKRGPKWVMAAELVETSRLYARTLARIEPQWIESLAGHLVKRSYFEPHWEKRPAQVAAFEQVSLYGLVLVPRRRINYGPLDPDLSRELFIRHALVRGEYRTAAAFQRHNHRLMEEIEALEHRERRRDILIDEQDIFAFFDGLLPAGIYSGKTFENWRKRAEREQPRLLFLDKAQLMRRPQEASAQEFPATLEAAEGLRLPLSYHFDPGNRCDGVTLTVPAAALNQLDARRLEWLVPGLLQDKVTALIRALPKTLRRNFVPAPDFAASALRAIEPGHGELLGTLAHQLKRMTGIEVPLDAWNDVTLPEYLRLNLRIVDAAGRPLAEGRELAVLRRELDLQARTHFEALPQSGWERDGIKAWDFGDLPERVEIAHHGIALNAYPALEDEGDSVAVRLVDAAERATELHRGGLRRLILLSLPQQARYLRRNLPDFERIALLFSGIGTADTLREDLIRAIVDRAFLDETTMVREQAVFEKILERGRSRLMEVAGEVCAAVADSLAVYHRLNKRLKGALSPLLLEAVRDMRAQLDQLIYPDFVSRTPEKWLREIPRYLHAIELRLEKLQGSLARDRRNAMEVTRFWALYQDRDAMNRRKGVHDDRLEEFRWLIEELRVSLFAQELGTVQPVSVERLKKRWDEIG